MPVLETWTVPPTWWYRSEGGMKGTGSAPLMIRREVPTRVWNARLNLLLPTRGLPKVMHRTSALGYSIAAHVAPAPSAARSEKKFFGFVVIVM